MVAGLFVAGISGCSTAPTYKVKVDAITKPTPATAQSFKIKSKDPRLGDENLRYREASEFVKTALSGKGLYEAPSEEKADMIVELDYGMEAPRTKIERVSSPSTRRLAVEFAMIPFRSLTRGVIPVFARSPFTNRREASSLDTTTCRGKSPSTRNT